MSRGFPRRAQAGVAVGVALTFLVMASSPALADHVRSQEWWLRTLHVTRAWRSTHGAGVTVAVLDTGVDAKQADLTGSVITGPDYTHSGRTPGGAFWGTHGTAVASIIAGHGHGAGNADGVIGIAPSAKILSVRVTLESNDPLLNDATVAAGLPGAIARGIRYAVKQHAAVIDLPLDPVTTPGAAGSGGSPAERAAVAYALARHVVLVAPAGDGGIRGDAVNYPAAYPGVISVGAFNEKFVKAPYSSHRAYVTLTAAGDGVTAANGLKGYALVHSTSAASAVVAGIAVLIKAQFPALTPAQVRQVLTTSTVFRPRGGRNDGSGYGTVDAASALMAASKMVEAVPASATGASGAAQAPPSAPAVDSTVVRKNLGHNLMTDAGIAVVVFLVLLGAIFGVTTWRRRRAREARLAEVRAATRVPVRKTRKPSGNRKPASSRKAGAGRVPTPAAAGTATGGGATGNRTMPAATWPPAGKSVAGAGLPGPGTSGAWVPGGALASVADGRADDRPGRAAPQIEPVGFMPAPLVPRSEPGRFPAAGSGSAGSGSAGSGAASAGEGTADPIPGSAPAVNAPPWAPIPDPNARFRGASSAAIPDSAFPGAADAPVTEPPGEPEAGADSGGAGHVGGHRAQGSHRASQVRTSTVAGSPPWEPAPRPDSELPWTQAAPPHGGPGLPQRQPARPQMPTWEAIAEEAWPGGPRVAKPHPPSPSATGPEPGPVSGPAGPVPQSGAAPDGWPQRDDGRPWDDRPPQTAQPGHAWNPDDAADPRSAAQPGHAWNPDGAAETRSAAQPAPRSGFLPGARPPTAGQQPGSRTARGADPAAPADPAAAAGLAARAGPAAPAASGTGPAGPGPFGTRPPRPPGAGPADADPPGAASPGIAPKTGIPPWEITDSFLAIRTERPGATRGGASPEEHGAPWEIAPDPRRPAESGGSFPAAPDVSAKDTGFPRGGASFPTTPAETRGSPAETRGSDLFSRGKADPPTFPLSGASFLAGAAEPTSFPGGSSFPGTPGEGTSLPGGGSSFPSTSAETPGFPRSGGSFPATPAESAGLPRGAMPENGTGDPPDDSTESFPTVTSSSGDQLPRRIPLSERTRDFPPRPQQGDDEASRLFPFGKKSDPPPGENTED